MLERVNVRTVTRHGNDWYPIAVWLVSAHVIGVVSYVASTTVFKAMGYTGTEPVVFVGGGERTTVIMDTAEVLGMRVQMAVFILTLAFWLARDLLRGGNDGE